MRSMTGFGRAQRDLGDRRVVVELRAINHKGLDVKVRAPRALTAHEPEITKRVRAACERGRVDVTVELEGTRAIAQHDVDALIALVGEVRGVGERVGAASTLTLGDLLHAMPRATEPQADAAVLASVDAATQDALAQFASSRASEGAALTKVLHDRLARVGELVGALATRLHDAPDRARTKLHARIAALGVDVEPARIAQEVALLAERLDVTEELDRLRMHVARFQVVMTEQSPGRALDFLCQELLREANTTGSKCQDAEAAHVVVELKAEIERIREQVQNVE
jgi:uncharacterized protein (TIGR00255 family)